MKVDSRHPFRHSGEKPVPYPDTGPESRGEGQDRHIVGRVPRPIFIPLAWPSQGRRRVRHCPTLNEEVAGLHVTVSLPEENGQSGDKARDGKVS